MHMDALVTKEQAAVLLDITVSGVRYLRRTGKLNGVKNGLGHLRFRRSQVLELRRERDAWKTEKVSA